MIEEFKKNAILARQKKLDQEAESKRLAQVALAKSFADKNAARDAEVRTPLF